MKKMFLAALFFSTSAFAITLTPDQEMVKQIAHNVGKSTCVKEVCFAKTLQAIAWQESSFGKNIDPNAKSPVYYYKENDKIIYIKKDETVVENNGRFYWRQPMHSAKFKKAYSRMRVVNIDTSSLGTFQIKPSTAKRVIEEMKLTQFKSLLTDEKSLVSRLLNDHKFSAIIAVNYIKLNYLHAKTKGYSDPWFFAVSKYNGGSKNHTYVNGILRKIRQL